MIMKKTATVPMPVAQPPDEPIRKVSVRQDAMDRDRRMSHGMSARGMEATRGTNLKRTSRRSRSVYR